MNIFALIQSLVINKSTLYSGILMEHPLWQESLCIIGHLVRVLSSIV